MKATEAVAAIRKHYEGLHDGDLRVVGLQPKLCPADVWTEGYGHAMRGPDGKLLRGIENKAFAYANASIKDEATATKVLIEDIAKYEKQVQNVLQKYRITVNQRTYDALVSIVFNCGIVALEKDGFPQSIIRAIQDIDMKRIEAAFMAWVYASRKIQPGLVAARKSEVHYIKTGEIKFFN
jgi:GH24 family phage-related lysozyme (muramidase)